MRSASSVLSVHWHVFVLDLKRQASHPARKAFQIPSGVGGDVSSTVGGTVT